MISVWWLLNTKSTYVSKCHLIQSYIGFVVIVSLILVLKFAF